MLQQYAPPQPISQAFQQLQDEHATLQRRLSEQRKLMASLERRVVRSLLALQTNLARLSPDGFDNPTWSVDLEAIEGEIHRLSDLIADTMLLQKLEAGKVTLHLEPIELSALVVAVSRHLSEPRNGTPVRFLCEAEPGLPAVMADRELTEAVLSDLLHRGLKYSASDSPVVLGIQQVGDRIHLQVTAQRFAPPEGKDYTPEIALCCKQIEVQGGEVTCQMRPDGLTLVTVALPIA